MAILGAMRDWLGALPADLAFLFGLPFFVAAVGLAADWWRSRSRH